ncbi:oxygen-independent coproporphyrinogen III oxidase [Gilvimarinus sp. SDUM040013]|uniref:Coproporphyrinogen-III oxidase n=1 Tax=Gilvimarinus gilvus TaxID=3058038 RepID=A0ABU4RWB3_9GAMM|nr:oxygen-independent coproporphyrinogen III oxidase [Gilvimarinus sp. SDUM040013]MDO3386588.1 oxygen-independent coproporphyrinogen III oxidase [Gilvimarinus sp. SDUM040013]MDX6849164.1 oxygen-independent coproporphyrinogen III oxidase [Gilvimarinus sp. SDUM040013]
MTQNAIATELIDRYDIAGPRYTSYPTAPNFSDDFPQVDLLNAMARSARLQRPLSLYFHLPFCESLCYYCGCNKVVTHNRSRVIAYLNRLEQEMADYRALSSGRRKVKQLHWGGGTPTYLNVDEMRLLMQMTRRHFHLTDDDSGDYAIEIHPGQTNVTVIPVLRELGFNRISMGVQDFDAKVQEAVNRRNSIEEVTALCDAVRENNFRSLNMDLIYGLPLQTAESFARTLQVLMTLRPDRISLFNYAHMPDKFKGQRLIKVAELPAPQQKMDIFSQAIATLTQAGYVHIGMDHFALPNDDLAVAQREGHLHRNFQGYSTYSDCDLLGFGVSSISAVGNVYWQNSRCINDYQNKLDEGRLPVEKGYRLSADDEIRRWVINQLICHYQLRFADIEDRFSVDPLTYFADQLEELEELSGDGLVVVNHRGIHITEVGKLLVRRICMVFDAYLPRQSVQYSKVI